MLDDALRRRLDLFWFCFKTPMICTCAPIGSSIRAGNLGLQAEEGKLGTRSVPLDPVSFLGCYFTQLKYTV